MAFLHLNLKGEYFDKIIEGFKTEEYRLYTPYWKKRLIGRVYDGILIKRGYPKREDLSKIVKRSWQGYEIKTISHPYFGDKPVKVFSINVKS